VVPTRDAENRSKGLIALHLVATQPPSGCWSL
jgi:hypothetical protein